MYTQFFGNYLLNKNYITAEQLIDALQQQQTVGLKLGVLAIQEGYMTANQVEQVHIMQTHHHKRFGELAVEEGFLTPKQLDNLLHIQEPSYLLFSQVLVDKGYLTTTQFEKAMMEYQVEYELSEDDFLEEQYDKILNMIQQFYNIKDIHDPTLYARYIMVLFSNIIRFIGSDFIPHQASLINTYHTNQCVTQRIIGKYSFETAIDLDADTCLAFASRYAGEYFENCDEYVQASIDDFMNLNNGLYVVNLSNESSLDLTLAPPICKHHITLSDAAKYFKLPVTFFFGTVHFLIEIK